VPPSAEQLHAQLGDLDPAQIAQLKRFAEEASSPAPPSSPQTLPPDGSSS
jgi:hypothetical protein